ncbi:MAG: hypothetical protein E7633_10845 [Ruminococcaceae bacterium]|nr:hypothetical protein [Oscillospiraceae bacterium]
MIERTSISCFRSEITTVRQFYNDLGQLKREEYIYPYYFAKDEILVKEYSYDASGRLDRLKFVLYEEDIFGYDWVDVSINYADDGSIIGYKSHIEQDFEDLRIENHSNGSLKNITVVAESYKDYEELWSWSYDEKGRLVESEYNDGITVKAIPIYEGDSTLPQSITFSISYIDDEQGSINSEETYQLTYTDGRITKISASNEEFSYSLTYKYNDNGNVLEQKILSTDNDGNVNYSADVINTFDDNGNKVKAELKTTYGDSTLYREWIVTEFAYDSRKNIVKESIVYYDENDTVQRKDVCEYVYNDDDFVISVKNMYYGYDETYDGKDETTIGYDSRGNKIKYVCVSYDENNNKVWHSENKIEYDDKNRKIKDEYKNVNLDGDYYEHYIETNEYDTDGKLSVFTKECFDIDGASKTKDVYKYDRDGNVTERKNTYRRKHESIDSDTAVGYVIVECTYNEKDLLLREVSEWYNSNGSYSFKDVSEYSYDSHGNKLQSKSTTYNADGVVTGNSVNDFEYDSQDRLIKDIFENYHNGKIVQYWMRTITYTATGYKDEYITKSYSDGELVRHDADIRDYDLNDNELKYTSCHYDIDGALAAKIECEYKYDEYGNRVGHTSTQWEYEVLISVNEAEYNSNGDYIKESEIFYDTEGNISEENTVLYEYDANGVPTKKTSISKDIYGWSYREELEFDENGNETKETRWDYYLEELSGYSIRLSTYDSEHRCIAYVYTEYDENGQVSHSSEYECKYNSEFEYECKTTYYDEHGVMMSSVEEVYYFITNGSVTDTTYYDKNGEMTHRIVFTLTDDVENYTIIEETVWYDKNGEETDRETEIYPMY